MDLLDELQSRFVCGDGSIGPFGMTAKDAARRGIDRANVCAEQVAGLVRAERT